MFFSDNWRVSAKLTANLGLRFDKNHGANSAGQVVSRDSAWSPRMGLVWDTHWRWSVVRERKLRQITSPAFPTALRIPDLRGGTRNVSVHLSGALPSTEAEGRVPTADAVSTGLDWFFATVERIGR